MKILVTGGAGFIGSHLVDALLSRGASVRVLDNLSTGRKANIEHCLDRIEFLEGDIRDPLICERACAGTACVFHQAALGSVPRSIADPATSIAVNVSGTANIFAAARKGGVKRVVYASSSSVYGDSPRLPKREGEEGEPLSPYALSKVMDEELAGAFGRSYRMELVGLRYFNVYGPRQDPEGPYAAVIPLFFKAYLTGRVPKVHGDGEQSRDFTYVEDAVDANLLAADAREAACGRAYNVAGGRRVTVNALAGFVRRLAGGSGDPEHGPERPGDVKHSLADLSAAREFLSYEPRFGLEEGLAAARSYYQSLYGGADA
jgi:nucleoside-diphosphate-sugar epimerase